MSKLEIARKECIDIINDLDRYEKLNYLQHFSLVENVRVTTSVIMLEGMREVLYTMAYK